MQALKTFAEVHDLMQGYCSRVVYASDHLMILEPANDAVIGDAVSLLKTHDIEADTVPTKDGRQFLSVYL